MQYLKQSTAATLKIGPFLDDTDGKTAEIALTIAQADVRLSKNGGNIAQKTEATSCTHDELGIYGCPIDVTDTATLGRLQLWVHESGALPVWHEYTVLPANVYDSMFSTDKLQIDLLQIGGVAQSATDLKDFADAGYDPATNKVQGVVLADTVTTLTGHTAQTGDSYARLGSPAAASIAADLLAIDNFVDELESRLTATRAGYLDNLSAGAVALASICTEARLAELAAANLPSDIDAILADVTGLNGDAMRGTDGANTTVPDVAGTLVSYDPPTRTEATADKDAIIADLLTMKQTAAGAYDRDTDSLEAIRNRGDAAWVTGGGGSISDILNVQPLIPNAVDLANTATIRISLGLTNMVDDLPSTAEIIPGTITIDRKAIGGTSWTNIVNAAACSELAGLIYYDEVFDVGTGYAAGDTIRITFKSQKITVAANDYEITSADGWIFHTYIRETMRGTNNANTTTPPTVGEVRIEMEGAGTKLTTIEGYTDKIDDGTNGLSAIKAEVEGLGGAVMRGTDSAALASVCTEARLAELAVANLPTDIDTILTRLSAARAGYLDNLSAGAVALASALTTHDGKLDTVDGIVDAILLDTGTDGVVVASGSKTGYALSAAGVDAIIDEVIEGTLTLRQMLRIIKAATAGKSTGGGTATLTFRDVADSKNRITATVDANGNRTAITVDGT